MFHFSINDGDDEGLFRRSGNLAAMIRNMLFGSSEVGVMYDPSDLASMFQDSAGTTPVTSVGQAVGLMLDKSKGLVLGPELVTNGGFDTDTAWTKVGDTTIAGGVLNCKTAGATQSILTAGKTYEVTFTVTIRSGSARVQCGTATSLNTFATAASGTYTARLLASDAVFYAYRATDGDMDFDNISVKELHGNHATQVTSTARPVLQQDSNGRYYLKFDGLDDFMVTPSIDFSGTDKMSVFAGVRKLSDAAAGAVVELGNGTITNYFAIFAPRNSAAAQLSFRAGGTTAVTCESTTSAAPITAVLSGLADTSGDAAQLRINAAVAQSVATDQGTGNYANAAVYLGRRGGSTLPFNGHLYSLIVRGALSDAAQISAAESYVNSKTGAY